MSVTAEPLNVLVIEDEPDLRSLLAEFLTREGHQVLVAESAEEGLHLLPQWSFQVALIDHQLPGMEGLLLGEYLRRNNPDMSIVLMTGLDDPRIERRSKDLHLTFLAKPFPLSGLSALLDAYARDAREREEQRHHEQDGHYDPPIEVFAGELTGCYAVPSVPGRIEGRVADTVKRCLSNLASAVRYTERDRVMALSGLLAAQVLGVRLPLTKAGLTLFEEYDRLMVARGRRTAFGQLAPGAEVMG
jgi:CheY-like chemotaxis protein